MMVKMIMRVQDGGTIEQCQFCHRVSPNHERWCVHSRQPIQASFLASFVSYVLGYVFGILTGTLSCWYVMKH